ncbi:MAG: hypothetical protein ACLQDM_05380 [Bradyrhizobium sp.]
MLALESLEGSLTSAIYVRNRGTCLASFAIPDIVQMRERPLERPGFTRRPPCIGPIKLLVDRFLDKSPGNF